MNTGELRQSKRRYRTVATFVFVVTLLCLSVWFGARQEYEREPLPELPIATSSAEMITLPTQIRIPKIGVDAPFTEPLGVTSSYEIQVPRGYEEVGYYKYGPAPGAMGPAVVLGHVDSFAGPAVFYSLGQLEVGDTIEIDREDGTTAVFAVDRLEHHTQAGFPTEKVYSDIDHAGLRLITCSGTYDRGEERYSHNLIVFATLVDIRENSL